MSTSQIGLLALAVFVLAGVAAARNPDGDVPQRSYRELNRQIYARHSDPGSGKLNSDENQVRSTSNKLHELITNEVETSLAGASDLETQVAKAISRLQGEMSFAAWDDEATNTPFAKVFSLNGIRSAAVAYVVMTGGDGIPSSQPYLEFYDNSSGTWERKASATTVKDFESSTFYVAQIQSGIPGEAWYLVWGVPTGNSKGSYYLRLYSYDNRQVKKIWQRGPLPYGKVTVKPDSVALEYEDEMLPDGMAHQVLHVTPNGLE